MRFSDIKEKHIYNVIFDDVRSCEFDGRHLALVLKKNSDNETVVVVPLTTSFNGEGINKFNIGKISSLPTSLRTNDSYAVYNQVRTLNSSRFIALKQGSNKINCPIPDDLFLEIVSYCSNELLKSLTDDEKIEYYFNQYSYLAANKLINLAYSIIRLKDSSQENKEEILNQIYTNIKLTWDSKINLSKFLKEIDKEKGILEIINSCIDNSIFDKMNSSERAS